MGNEPPTTPLNQTTVIYILNFPSPSEIQNYYHTYAALYRVVASNETKPEIINFETTTTTTQTKRVRFTNKYYNTSTCTFLSVFILVPKVINSVMDSLIILEPKGGLVEEVEGSTLLDSPIKPTTVGLKMIDAPNGVANGLAYRINGCNLERILVTEDEDSASSIKVVGSCILSGGAVGAVHLKASPDGRLVAVACIDGSLQCYDSTATSISLRWSISDAHSHVTPSISSPVSADRSHAACGSGPILALDFSSYDYNLVLVDATKGMAIYDAGVADPINLIPSTQQQMIENVSSAAWCGSIATKECDGAAIPIAIGRFDGSIAILSCNSNSYPSDVLEPISELGCPSEEDGSVCTHLNWTSDTFVAGICRVFPPEDDEDPDEDDEDDNADHEACLYVTTIDDSLNRCADWMEQGDVVPFFTVPKFGRHVFFTSFLPHTGGKLIAVGTNVGTDIGAVSSKKDSDGINDVCWQPVEFQEGATATTPTNEDDEFAFPLGISILQLSSSSFRLLLAATDGSLSIFEYQHINDPKYFSSPVLGSTADLPSDPLVTTTKSPSATSNSISPPQTPETASWVVVDENKDDDLENSVTPVLTTTIESTNEVVQSANTTNSGLFESGFKPSSFGSGNVSGLTFGSPNSGGSPFASFGRKVDETSVFGAVSSLSATASPVTSTPVKPTNAFGSTGTFGSSTPSSIGGFAGLSSGGGAFGSSNTPSPGGSAFGSSPFIAFSKSSTPASTVGGFSVKPLFGQASAPPTSTSEPTTVSGKPAAAAAATGTASSKGIGEDGNNNKEKETIAAFKEFVKNFGRKKKPTSPTKGFNFGFGNNASSGAPPGFAPSSSSSSSSSSCPFKHGPSNKTNSSFSSAPRQRSQNDNGVVVIPHYSLKVHYKTLEMVDDDGNYLDNNPREIYVKKFKRLCLIHHPDKNNGKDRKFKELNNARHAIREYYDFTWH